ncbi:hypothetical protein TNCV_1176791 [Trichonephila clavipes]|nr:hypothetical protein TNCV_1176791 [Trichonephila clavipes]
MSLHKYLVGFGGVDVAYPLRKPNVAGFVPARVDRFSGYENRRHACHDYVAYKTSLEYQFGSGTLEKIKSRLYLASDESLNRIQTSLFGSEAATRWCHQ